MPGFEGELPGKYVRALTVNSLTLLYYYYYYYSYYSLKILAPFRWGLFVPSALLACCSCSTPAEGIRDYRPLRVCWRR